jgi:hypothetical protein
MGGAAIEGRSSTDLRGERLPTPGTNHGQRFAHARLRMTHPVPRVFGATLTRRRTEPLPRPRDQRQPPPTRRPLTLFHAAACCCIIRGFNRIGIDSRTIDLSCGFRGNVGPASRRPGISRKLHDRSIVGIVGSAKAQPRPWPYRLSDGHPCAELRNVLGRRAAHAPGRSGPLRGSS